MPCRIISLRQRRQRVFRRCDHFHTVFGRAVGQNQCAVTKGQTCFGESLARAVRVVLPNGAEILYNAYISLNKTPSLTVNEIMACEVTLSLLAEPVRY